MSEVLRTAVRLPCLAARGTDLRSLAERLPQVEPLRNWVHFSPAGITKRRLLFDVAGDVLVLQFAGPVGNPRSVTVRLAADRGERPLVLAIADESCTIHTARRLRYDRAGRPRWLDELDSRLRPVGDPAPLNPRVPEGEGAAGVPVGLVDSGVNYLLPEIASRLARDPDGHILGYDYWDLDRRPFDWAPIPDPFFPTRHGTRTASLVLEWAPMAALVPYRYPRSDMTRMAELIEHAAARGVTVMNVSLASRHRDEWASFRSAARHHSEMLFVVAAGNNALNVDREPVYPAALPLDNMVVVTAAGAGGRLIHGVNWGPESVDLMARGEGVVVRDFDGERRTASGSSYAAARVSALATCLLARHPDYGANDLKAALFSESRPDETGRVAQGFIPDEALHRACRPPILQGSS